MCGSASCRHRFIENVYAKPVHVLDSTPGLNVRCYLNGSTSGGKLTVELRDGTRGIASMEAEVPASADHVDLNLNGLRGIELWSLKKPKLYSVVTRLRNARWHQRRLH